MARKTGILSDKYFRENCLEYQPTKVGLMQQLNPYVQNQYFTGIKMPKDIPVASRPNTLAGFAENVSAIKRLPYQEVEQQILQAQKTFNLPKDSKISTVVAHLTDQPSLLAKTILPPSMPSVQLHRPVKGIVMEPTGPTGDKTGPTDEDSTGPTGM